MQRFNRDGEAPYIHSVDAKASAVRNVFINATRALLQPRTLNLWSPMFGSNVPRRLEQELSFDNPSLARGAIFEQLRRGAIRTRSLHTQPIGLLAASCGFRNAAHFCRLFKAEFGVPPSAVRQLRTADGEHGARAHTSRPISTATRPVRTARC